MLLFAALAVGLGTPGPLPYPISPRPLRLLVQQSEFIVIARVREAEPNRRELALKEEGAFGDRVVVLDIESLVKGDPGVTAIEQVTYSAGCPSPPRYVDGKRVLAFLDRRPGARGFTTPAYSYGVKTLDDAGLALYLERIREQLAILEMRDDELRLATQVEWLVTCAENAATRWEGAFELAPDGDIMFRYVRAPVGDFARHLSNAQRERLRAAFLAAPTLGLGESCLEELFRDDEDPRLQAWLVDQLRAHCTEVEERSLGAAAILIQRIARRDERPEVRKLAAGFAALWGYPPHAGDAQGRLEVCRELLALF